MGYPIQTIKRMQSGQSFKIGDSTGYKLGDPLDTAIYYNVGLQLFFLSY